MNPLETFRVPLDDHRGYSSSLQGLQPSARALPVKQAVHLRPAELQDRPHEGAQLSEVGCRTRTLHEVGDSRVNRHHPSS